MRQKVDKGRIIIWVVLIILVIAALLPKSVSFFFLDETIWTKLLGVVMYIGVLLLLWFIMSVAGLILTTVCNTIRYLLTGKDYVLEDDGISLIFIVSATIILIMQFIGGWGIKPNFLNWVLSQTFPFLK